VSFIAGPGADAAGLADPLAHTGIFGNPVAGFFATLVVLVVLTVIAGRLLGVRLRWSRVLLAGFPGLIAGIAVVWALAGRRRTPQSLPLPGILLAALIATMLIVVLLDLLARPGGLTAVEGRLHAGRVPHPLRSLRRRVSHARRYLEVTRIVTRHGLASYLGGRGQSSLPRRAAQAQGGVVPVTERPRPLARSARAALEEAGGMFIKLGQVLSTRSDLLPADVIAELSGLQDHVTPVGRADIEELLTAELGAPPADVFASFDPEPLAAASIGQVHRARLASGEQVVVKVQRPGVRALVERDLDILLKLARSLEARASWAREYRVVEMAGGFADALAEELDFRVEARNIAAVASASSAIRVPAVYPGLSTSRVLVLERLDGVSARDAGPLLDRSGADRHALARDLLGCVLRQVMISGTFHADPHPGNVLALRDGQLALIDFGSVGRLDPIQQAGLRRLVLAVARRNPSELHGALLDLAHTRPAAGDDVLERALAQFMAQHLGPGMVPDAAMFTALFRLLTGFGITFSPVIGGVFRAMITLEGTLTLLAPGFKIVDETRGLAGSWLGDLAAPSSLRAAAADELIGLLPVLRRLPRRVDRLTTSLEQGTLTVSTRIFADDRDTRFIRAMVSRAVLAFLGATIGIMSVFLLNIREGPVLIPGAAAGIRTTIFQAFGYLGLFFSLVLILRVIITIIREGIS
jgi:ubiquinone biosynthesis protein